MKQHGGGSFDLPAFEHVLYMYSLLHPSLMSIFS